MVDQASCLPHRRILAAVLPGRPQALQGLKIFPEQEQRAQPESFIGLFLFVPFHRRLADDGGSPGPQILHLPQHAFVHAVQGKLPVFGLPVQPAGGFAAGGHIETDGQQAHIAPAPPASVAAEQKIPQSPGHEGLARRGLESLEPAVAMAVGEKDDVRPAAANQSAQSR